MLPVYINGLLSKGLKSDDPCSVCVRDRQTEGESEKRGMKEEWGKIMTEIVKVGEVCNKGPSSRVGERGMVNGFPWYCYIQSKQLFPGLIRLLRDNKITLWVETFLIFLPNFKFVFFL